MENIRKILKTLEDFELLIKGVGQTIETETKEQKDGFLGMLLEILGTSLLGNMFVGKGVKAARQGQKVIKAMSQKWQRIIKRGEGTIRTGQEF